MTPEHIAVVQESFQKVATIADQAAAMFYKNLFILDNTFAKNGEVR
jgi:hypothetical protein